MPQLLAARLGLRVAVAAAAHQLQCAALLTAAAARSTRSISSIQSQQQQQQQQHGSSLQRPLEPPPAWQHQQRTGYHRSTHRARALTVRLLQQQRWQDLQLMYDAAGGAQKLNPIQLCALTQTLARLAPPAELLATAERQHLQGFATEVASACVAKLHRFDAVGLSNVLSSLSALGVPLQLAQPQQRADSTSSGAAGQLDLHGQVLAAATRHVAAANGHACAMLLTALARQQHQQQQEAVGSHPPEQHAQLWAGLLTALHCRVEQLTAAGQVNSAAASSICLAASRLSGTFAAAARSHSSSSSSNIQQEQEQQQQAAAAPSLHQQLRSLLSLAAQQVVHADAFPDSPAAALAQPSRVLYALAKRWAWPGWPALQGLLQRFAVALADASSLAPQAELVSTTGTGGRGRKRGYSSADASGILALLQQHQPRPARTQRAAGAAAAAGDTSNDDAREEIAAARRESLPQVLWAAGRLVEQRQQRGTPTVTTELQQHAQLWAVLGPVLQAALEQLRWLGPLQLAQTASGLGKLVQSSTRLLAAVAAPDTDATQAAAVAAAQQLQAHLRSPVLQRLQAAHVGRVEALLPLLSVQHRRQLADGYGRLGLAGQRLPQAVRAVFERDAAAAVVVGAG